MTGLLNVAGSSPSEGFELKSLRFNDDDTPRLERTPGSDGNLGVWTLSTWIKRGKAGTGQCFFGTSGSASTGSWIRYGYAGDESQINLQVGGSANWTTNAIYRDVSAWYHVVVAYDKSQSTSITKCRIYVNGIEQTFLTASNSSLDTAFNDASFSMNVGRRNRSDSYTYFDGYMSEFYWIDGTQLTPSSFAETNALTNQWQPKEPEDVKGGVTFGTNGFYLDFEDSADLGNDVSGNGNDFTPTNLAATDQMLDSPMNNWCTWNSTNHNSSVVLSEGNLKGSHTSNANIGAEGTIAFPTTGKWYYELLVTGGQPYGGGCGAIDVTITRDGGAGRTGAYAYGENGIIYANGTSYSGAGATFTTGDITSLVIDSDASKIYFYKNGVAQGAAGGYTIGAGQELSAWSVWYNAVTVANFGQDSSFAGGKTAQGNQDANGKGDFYYTPARSSLAVCTDNLPDPSISGVEAGENFNTVLYTGNGSTQSITGAGFQPDLVWMKDRGTTYYHSLSDSVRGSGKELYSNTSGIENTGSNLLTSFDSDGFSVGNDNGWNQNTNSKVAWLWEATGGAAVAKTYVVTVAASKLVIGGFSQVTVNMREGSTYTFDTSDSSVSGHTFRFATAADAAGSTEYTTGVTETGTTGSAGAKTVIVVAASAPQLYYYCSVHSSMGGSANTNTTAGSSNFDGAISSTVSANTTSGFSIVNYTGNATSSATVGHGLSQAPDCVIVKELGNADSWMTLWRPIGATVAPMLNEDGAAGASVNYWQDTLPSATVVTLGSNNKGNGTNSAGMIMYCFHSVEGYSKVDSYIGNASADGPFVFLGFKPSLVLIKASATSSTNWHMYDNKRLGYNVDNNSQRVNLATVDQTDDDIDLLSNGFKIRRVTSALNNNAATYIYLAFAESPFKTSNAR